MAAFFAIPISDFPGNYSSASGADSNGLPMAYVAKYTFGIGLGISAVIIALAFNMDLITLVMRRTRTRFRRNAPQGWWNSRVGTLMPYMRTAAGHSFVDDLRGKDMEMYGLMAATSADRRGRRSVEVASLSTMARQRGLSKVSRRLQIDGRGVEDFAIGGGQELMPTRFSISPSKTGRRRNYQGSVSELENG